VGSDTIHKSVLGAAFDGINRQRHNRSFQRVREPSLMRFHPLGHGPNGPMASFPAITVFLAVLEHQSNGRDTSNGHIDPPW
jgi:hypothetical protein